MEVDILFEANNELPKDYYIRTEEQFCLDELRKHFDLALTDDPRRLTVGMTWLTIGHHAYFE